MLSGYDTSLHRFKCTTIKAIKPPISTQTLYTMCHLLSSKILCSVSNSCTALGIHRRSCVYSSSSALFKYSPSIDQAPYYAQGLIRTNSNLWQHSLRTWTPKILNPVPKKGKTACKRYMLQWTWDIHEGRFEHSAHQGSSCDSLDQAAWIRKDLSVITQLEIPFQRNWQVKG
jgi:hypothetical protein